MNAQSSSTVTTETVITPEGTTVTTVERARSSTVRPADVSARGLIARTERTVSESASTFDPLDGTHIDITGHEHTEESVAYGIVTTNVVETVRSRVSMPEPAQRVQTYDSAAVAFTLGGQRYAHGSGFALFIRQN